MKERLKRKLIYILLFFGTFVFAACTIEKKDDKKHLDTVETSIIETTIRESIVEETTEAPVDTVNRLYAKHIYLDKNVRFATYSMINDSSAILYTLNKNYAEKKVEPKGIVVAVNAGHGTKGGENIKTYAHPDFSPKYVGMGTTGSDKSPAISIGTDLNCGIKEADANLIIATRLKDKLLDAGYDVLMIRENEDTRLDNIARTVIANENADCHIALHFDSTERDKGVFYIVPYKEMKLYNMEPLKSNLDNILAFGDAIIDGFKEKGMKVWNGSGKMQGDLTQLSYSTNPSIDIELGDRATIIDEVKIEELADALLLGIDNYFSDDKK